MGYKQKRQFRNKKNISQALWGEAMNEEFRKAIEQVEDLLGDMCIPTPDHLDAIKKLKDLAQDYLSCGELERKERNNFNAVGDYYGLGKIDGYNEAVHQHKLIILKKQEELRKKCEGIEEILRRFEYYHKNSKSTDNLLSILKYTVGDDTEDFIENLATALKNELMGEGEK